MTESSSVASSTVQARHTPRQLALVGAAVSLAASAASASVIIQAVDEKLSSKVIFATLFWATPLALAIFFSFWATLKELPDDSTARRYRIIVPMSALLGLGWTFVVVLLLDGNGDADVRVLATWIAGGIWAMSYPITHTRHRIWAAPMLILTVLGAALIDLGAFTDRS